MTFPGLEDSLKNRAVILDRDGVINLDKGYIHRIEDFELLPKVIDALRLIPPDFKLIVITNQSGIARGLYTEDQFLTLTERIKELLSEKGIQLDRVYYCPHSPSDNCRCRKPGTALLEQAIKDFDLDPNRCWVIGDKASDIKMGETAGCHTILVNATSQDELYLVNPEYVAEDLYDAICHILSIESH